MEGTPKNNKATAFHADIQSSIPMSPTLIRSPKPMKEMQLPQIRWDEDDEADADADDDDDDDYYYYYIICFIFLG